MMQYSLLDRRPEESCLDLIGSSGIGGFFATLGGTGSRVGEGDAGRGVDEVAGGRGKNDTSGQPCELI